MKTSYRDKIADAAIKAVFQEYVDDIITLDEVMEKLWGMYHPIVGKTPKECGQRELDVVTQWHNHHAESMVYDAMKLARIKNT